MFGQKPQIRMVRRYPWSKPVPVPMGLPPQRPLSSRILRLAAKGMWKAHKHGWARRRPLAPLYGTIALFIAGVVAHGTPKGWCSIAILSLFVAGFFAAREYIANHQPRWLTWIDPRPLRRMEWAYVAGVWSTSTAWLLWAAVMDPWPPRTGWLLVPLAVSWAPAAWKYRIRHHEDHVTHPMVELWTEYGSGQTGVAPGSLMYSAGPLNPEDLDLATTATVELPRGGTMSAAGLARQTERIAGIYDTDVASIAVEKKRGSASVRYASVTVFQRNPLRDDSWWLGPHAAFDPQTGLVKAARRLTGGHALYRYYKASGPVHDFIAGATDSGKSMFVSQLLAIERDSPFMASVVIDPQRGQSFPDWRGQVAHYARSVNEGRLVLRALLSEMFRRNEVLADVPWTDEEGRNRFGVGAFDVHSKIIQDLGMPLVVVTIDEAGMQLGDPESLAACIAMSTMARKCGIKLRLIFQSALLDQVRSQILRDQLKGGNRVIFRTGSPIAGQVAFDGLLPADPHSLPSEWPDGKTAAGLVYILGPNASSVMCRTEPIADIYHWATVGETRMLPELDALLALGDGDSDGAMDAILRSDQLLEFAPETRKKYGDTILPYLEEHRYATTGTLGEVCGVPVERRNSISSACRRLADKHLIIDHGHGMWGSLDTAEESPEEQAA